MSAAEPGEKRRFQLELWLEPRAVVSHLFRLRGRMQELPGGDEPCSVSGIGDVDAFIRRAFAAPDREVRWEAEP